MSEYHLPYKRGQFPSLPGAGSNMCKPFMINPEQGTLDCELGDSDLEFLVDLYPGILQEAVLDYVRDFVTSETIESWLDELQEQEDVQSVDSESLSDSGTNEYSSREISKLEVSLLEQASTTCDGGGSMYRIRTTNFDVTRNACIILMNAVKADGLSIYLPDDTTGELQFAWRRGLFPHGDVQLELARSVATTKIGKFIRQNGVPILSVPILMTHTGDTRVLAVVECTRNQPWLGIFTESDLQIGNFLMCWLGIALCSINENLELNKHNELNEYLVEAITEMFKNIDHQDEFFSKIMTYTKNLVNAERCGLFLLDQENNELYADMFDEGKLDEEGNATYEKSKRVRFPPNQGIVGHTIATGQVNNVMDCANDPRFFGTVDETTGFKSEQILCAPISTKGSQAKLFGAVEAINKRNGRRFTQFDEDSLSVFAVYVGMAVNYAHVYNKMKRDVIMTEIAAEQLRYHIFLHCDEALTCFLPLSKAKPIPDNFEDYSYFPAGEMEKGDVQELIHYMLFNRFGQNTFELRSIILCVVLIRENYTAYPYHNWKHALTVSHCAYKFMEFMMESIFTKNEALAIFLTCVAHDMNYRGYGCLKKTERMSYCFTTPVEDFHNYHTLVHILKCNNIFSSLTALEYRQVLEDLRENFEALDLDVVHENLSMITNLIDTKRFDMTNPTHKRLFKGIVVVACDLCTMFKEWKHHVKDVIHVARELARLSDRQSSIIVPNPEHLQKLSKKDIPPMILPFIKNVARPLFHVITKICPETSAVAAAVDANLRRWQTIYDGGYVEHWDHNRISSRRLTMAAAGASAGLTPAIAVSSVTPTNTADLNPSFSADN